MLVQVSVHILLQRLLVAANSATEAVLQVLARDMHTAVGRMREVLPTRIISAVETTIASFHVFRVVVYKSPRSEQSVKLFSYLSP